MKLIYKNHKVQFKKGSNYLCHELEPYKYSFEQNIYNNATYFKENLVQIPIDLNFAQLDWLNRNKSKIKNTVIKNF